MDVVFLRLCFVFFFVYYLFICSRMRSELPSKLSSTQFFVKEKFQSMKGLEYVQSTNISIEAFKMLHLPPPNRLLIATLLTDDIDLYSQGAAKLIVSIKQSLRQNATFALLTIDTKPLNETVKARMECLGWNIYVVSRIVPHNEEGTYYRFRDQFTKLLLWNFTYFTKVLYLDSDTFVIGNIESILSHPMGNNSILVARDIKAGVWQDTFNMGVFVITPNVDEFHRLIELKDERKIHFETGMAEQGFLNAVYKNEWGDIGFVNNANLAAYEQDNSMWLANEENINIIHYTMQKPWSCHGLYKVICRKWLTFQVEGC